ncbi:MAG: tRNA threonylcarbamoyladenosine dehydratase [Clostridia bacterium]|nr:tRNA threonylcarbamoyladenosine dehydratase [Clostridia bacterium]
MIDQFSRTKLLIGEDGIKKLKESAVAIFGIGGVGSYTAEALSRAGVGSLILVDKDEISITNINRQIHSTFKTVGRSKVEVMRDRILEINPEANVKIFNEFYLPENAEKMLDKSYSYIVDAVDTVTAKVDLVMKANEYNIPIISAMGAANKLDPTKFEVTDIFKTSVCPLAKVMRKELKARGIKKLKVVYSKEEPVKVTYRDDIEDFAPGKKNIPGSISFVPSVMGLIIAGEVIKDLIRG